MSKLEASIRKVVRADCSIVVMESDATVEITIEVKNFGLTYDMLAGLAKVLGTKAIDINHTEERKYSEDTIVPATTKITVRKIPAGAF